MANEYSSAAGASHIKEVLLLHHTHTDIGYTHPVPILWELQRRFIDRAINLADETADWPDGGRFVWTCETTCGVLHWMQKASSRDIDRFRAAGRRGQIGVAGMFCNITPLYSAEMLARSLQPIRMLRDRFGVPVRVAINHDVNGLAWPLSDMLLDCGIELLIMGINIVFGGFPLHRPMAFNWKTPSGRKLLSFNGEHYNAFNREARLRERSTEAMAVGLQDYIRRLPADYPFDFIYMTVTRDGFDDNNPPDARLPHLIRQWNNEGREPRIRLITPEQLLQKLGEQDPKTIPAHGGDWSDYWNFGCASSTRETAIGQRAAARLASADLLAAFYPLPMEEKADPPAGDAENEDAPIAPIIPADPHAEAWCNLLLWGEHTWGGFASIAHPSSDNTAEQWHYKAHYAYKAKSLTHLLMSDLLDRLAGNRAMPADDGAIKGLLLFNPAPFKRTTYISMPANWQSGKWSYNHSKSLSDPELRCVNDSAVTVGPIELPASGWRTVPLSKLPVASPARGLKATRNTIESPTHRLTFNPKTGRIVALLDKAQRWQVIDDDSPWAFFGFVEETVMGRPNYRHFGREHLHSFDWRTLHRNISGWITDWRPRRRPVRRLRECRVEREADRISIVMSFDAPGVDALEQRITLFAHRPAIELTASFTMRDIVTPQGIYFPMPMRLPGWRAHFDSAGLPVEYEAEQLTGSCTDYVTVGRWVSVHNEKHGITLACPDAPMVQIGDFKFARQSPIGQRPDRMMLLPWPANNYWMTNFRASQPGTVKVRYELLTHGAFDAATSMRLGAEASTPVEVHPIAAAVRPRSQQLIDVKGRNVQLLHTSPAHDQRGIVLRMLNAGSKKTTARVRLVGQGISEASICSPMEEMRTPLPLQNGEAAVEIGPRSIQTVFVTCATATE